MLCEGLGKQRESRVHIVCLFISQYLTIITYFLGLPCSSDDEESACNAGDERDMGLIPGSGSPSGEGNGNSLQYSCLENAMDRGAWKVTVHGVAKNQIRLNDSFSQVAL